MLVTHSDRQVAIQMPSFNSKHDVSGQQRVQYVAAYLASDEFPYNSEELKKIQKTYMTLKVRPALPDHLVTTHKNTVINNGIAAP